jgi:hypothetical protein
MTNQTDMVMFEPGQIWFPNSDMSIMKNVSQMLTYGSVPRQISHTFEWKYTVWVVYNEFFDKEKTHVDSLINFKKWVKETNASNVPAQKGLFGRYTREHQKHIIIVQSYTDIWHEIVAWIIENVEGKWSLNTRFKKYLQTGSLMYCFEASFEDLQTATLFRLRF